MGKVKATATPDDNAQPALERLMDGVMEILGRDDRDEARGSQVFGRIAQELQQSEEQ